MKGLKSPWRRPRLAVALGLAAVIAAGTVAYAATAACDPDVHAALRDADHQHRRAPPADPELLRRPARNMHLRDRQLRMPRRRRASTPTGPKRLATPINWHLHGTPGDPPRRRRHVARDLELRDLQQLGLQPGHQRGAPSPSSGSPPVPGMVAMAARASAAGLRRLLPDGLCRAERATLGNLTADGVGVDAASRRRRRSSTRGRPVHQARGRGLPGYLTAACARRPRTARARRCTTSRPRGRTSSRSATTSSRTSATSSATSRAATPTRPSSSRTRTTSCRSAAAEESGRALDSARVLRARLLPPVPSIAGAAVSHEDLVLESADGTRFAAFSATPDVPSAIGIVVLPDVRGLYRFYEGLALRFAERGFAAIAFDYFGRTAGVGKRDDDFPYMDHVPQTDAGGDPGRRRRRRRLAALARAARAARSSRSASASAAATRGSPPQTATTWPGAVGFYGGPGERNGQPGAIQLASEIEAPILALQAGDDAEHHPRGQRRPRRGPDRRGRGARGRDLRRRAPQLLRPPPVRAPGRLGRRLGPVLAFIGRHA